MLATALVQRRLAHLQRLLRIEREQIVLDDPVLQHRYLAPDLGEEVLARDVVGRQAVDDHADLLVAVIRLGPAAHRPGPQFVGQAVHLHQQFFARGQGLAVGLLGRAARLDVERELGLIQVFADAEGARAVGLLLRLVEIRQEVHVSHHGVARIGDALRELGLLGRREDRFLRGLAKIGQHGQRARRL